jgi:hypothetical protein
MPDIKDSVGAGGTNAVHDVAMVQLMLRLVKNAKGAPYFAADDTGTPGDTTKNAIVAFQTDQKLLGSPSGEKSGFVGKGSQTLAKLSAAVPAAYASAWIIADTRTVYLAMDAATAQKSANAVEGSADLDPAFRGKVANLINQMHQHHKIALSIPASGGRRTFDQQAALSPAVTGAGPGESNHQYGQAVDIGFGNLQWVKGNGQVVKDNYWLSAGGLPADKQNAFWAARDAIAFDKLGLFKTNKPGDLIHVQAYADANVSYARSLAALLNVATVTKSKWEPMPGRPNKYKNDFGLGGATHVVGTAREIWAGKAVVNAADLAAALNAKLAADKAFDVLKFFGIPPVPKQAPPIPPLKAADVKAAYLTKIRADLKADLPAPITGESGSRYPDA